MTTPLENITSHIRAVSIGRVYAGPSPKDEETPMDENATPNMSEFAADNATPESSPMDVDCRIVYAGPSQMDSSNAVGFFDNITNSFGGFGEGMGAAYPQSFAEEQPSASTGKHFCPECGGPVGATDAFCSCCGTPLPKNEDPAEVDIIGVYNGPEMMP